MAAYNVINSQDNASTLTNVTEIRKCKYAEGEQCYYSDEHLLWSINKHLEPEPHEWIFCVLFIIVFIFGVTGNSLVCFAVWRNVQLRTITNFFLVNLAVADLLVIVICLPPTFAQTFWETWFLGDAMCKIVEFLQNISVIVSVLTLTAISIERWFAICHPLSFKETRRHVIITLIIIWVAANVFSIPSLIIFSTVPDAMVPGNLTILLTTCRPFGYEQTTLFKEIIHLVVFYVIPVIVMTFAYFSIASCLWSSIKKGKALTEGMRGMQDQVSYQLRSRRRAAKMLIVVVIVFVLCYLPVYIWNILRMTNLELINQIPDKKVSGIGYTAHLLIYLNSSINPVIYNFMSGKFRKEFQTAFFCCFRRRRTEGSHYGSHELEPFPSKSYQESKSVIVPLTCYCSTRTWLMKIDGHTLYSVLGEKFYPALCAAPLTIRNDAGWSFSMRWNTETPGQQAMCYLVSYSGLSIGRIPVDVIYTTAQFLTRMETTRRLPLRNVC